MIESKELLENQKLAQKILFEIIELKIKEFLLNYTSKYNVFNGTICKVDEAEEILSLDSVSLMRVAYEIKERSKNYHEPESYTYIYITSVCCMIMSLHSVRDKNIVGALGYYFEAIKSIGDGYTKNLCDLRMLDKCIL